MANKKKIYFRADADQSIGFGHFIRSLAFADMVKEEYDCTFFTQTPSEYQKEEVRKICRLVELPANETKFALFADRLIGDEIVVLDNYFFSSDYQKQIKNKGCKLVCLGSNDRHYYADVLINYTNLTPDQFKVEDYTKICSGIGWTLLRRPFWSRDTAFRAVPEKIDNIVVCFGGTDPFTITEKITDYLLQRNKTTMIQVIATDSFGVERLTRLSQKGIILHINASADKIASVLETTDLAILSASSVVQEALALYTPVIAGYYIDNQLRLYNTLLEGNYIFGVGDWLAAPAIGQMEKALYTITVGQTSKVRLSISDLKQKYLNLLEGLWK